jgi:hypothetical protein
MYFCIFYANESVSCGSWACFRLSLGRVPFLVHAFTWCALFLLLCYSQIYHATSGLDIAVIFVIESTVGQIVRRHGWVLKGTVTIFTRISI